jgi:DNA uptake protein ComE-like DNA-binding protein
MSRTGTVTLALLTLTTAASAQVGKSLGVLDPNVSAEKELLALPGMTPAIVEALMARRPFLTMTELNVFLVPSFSREQLTVLYGKLFLALNLNSAAKEEILMIPGVGNRMLREFEEYRPYDGLARFRREMAKYVDAAEVARLEQYVFVPVNVNSASDEDILTIPGVGARMLREFKEYRPYDGIERFRREIGKYVNAKEVARLERYVTVK